MTISPDLASYLRVASIAIGAYDYLVTLPAEWRFYEAQRRVGRLSLLGTLFVLIRYLSVAVVIVGNYGGFSTSFTEKSCQRWFLLAPSLKGLQAMVSQAILGMTSFNLSRRSRIIFWALVAAYCTACIFQWLSNTYHRTSGIDVLKHCRAIDKDPLFGAWIHYAVAMIFDSIVTTISLTYLLKYRSSLKTSMLTKVTNILLYDGLIYFLLLTAANIFNLVIYWTAPDPQQRAGVSLGYVATWVTTQRLLIHLNDAAIERSHVSSLRTITRSVSSRSQFGTGSKNTEWTEPHFSSITQQDEPVSVRVRMERTIQEDVGNDNSLSRMRNQRNSSARSSNVTQTQDSNDKWVPRRMIPDPRPPLEPMMQTRW